MSMLIELIVAKEEEGLRLDQLLARRITNMSRTQLKTQIEQGEVTVNGEEVRPRNKVKPGDRIRIAPGQATVHTIQSEAIPLKIVYEDADLAVIDKPAGLVVHPGAGIKSGTLVNALMHHFRSLSDAGENFRPGIVHRLDRGTSGLMVVAKTNLAWLNLTGQFKARSVSKRYCALVYGRPSLASGAIEHPIGRHPYHRTRMAVRSEGKGRAASTLYRTMERFRDFTLLELTLKTGRTHQIRVHLSHVGLPVVGDISYGGAYVSKIREQSLRKRVQDLGRPFLHARELEFVHPGTGRQRRFEAPLPAELEELLEIVRAKK